MKKIIVFILMIILMLSFVITSCDTKDDDGDDGEETSTATVEESTDEGSSNDESSSKDEEASNDESSSEEESTSEHQHDWEWVDRKPGGCETPGKIVRECACGASDEIDDDEKTALGHNYENGFCKRCEQPDPVFVRDGNTVYFGEYPQTILRSAEYDETVEELNALAGELPYAGNSQKWTSYGYYISGEEANYMWYIDLEYNLKRYRGVYFTQYRPSITGYSSGDVNSSQDDHAMYASNVYWFEYEPIEWTVISESEGKAVLLCNMVIDAQAYQNKIERSGTQKYYITGTSIYANNYEYSTIRAWLNNTFYETAFSELQKAIIVKTSVDNSNTTFNGNTSTFVSPTTEDNVFLLSTSEINSYGFTSEQLVKKSTDYAEAQGVPCEASSSNELIPWWALRSPNGSAKEGINVQAITAKGAVSILQQSNGLNGIVPAITVNLNK